MNKDTFILQLSMFAVQIVLAIIGLFYGIVLLIRKDRTYYILLFTLSMWGLGSVRAWPQQRTSPIMNQTIFILLEIIMFLMVYLFRKK